VCVALCLRLRDRLELFLGFPLPGSENAFARNSSEAYCNTLAFFVVAANNIDRLVRIASGVSSHAKPHSETAVDTMDSLFRILSEAYSNARPCSLEGSEL
jgi:hypothetical protein